MCDFFSFCCQVWNGGEAGRKMSLTPGLQFDFSHWGKLLWTVNVHANTCTLTVACILNSSMLEFVLIIITVLQYYSKKPVNPSLYIIHIYSNLHSAEQDS